MQAAAAVNGGGDVQKQHQQQPVVVAPHPPPAAVVPPHWVAMPFAPPPGAAAMVMPHQMTPASPQFAAAHFLPFHALAAPPPRAAVAMGSPAPQAGQEENRTIWVGDLHYWMDENYLHSCFGYTGEVSSRAPCASFQVQILATATLSLNHLRENKKSFPTPSLSTRMRLFPKLFLM
jgi:hypothetical protein